MPDFLLQLRESGRVMLKGSVTYAKLPATGSRLEIGLLRGNARLSSEQQRPEVEMSAPPRESVRPD